MTLTVEKTRARLARRRVKCHPKCKGWFIADSDTYGLEIEACDECNQLCKRGDTVTDGDVDLLPEARRALYRQAGKVTITLSGEEYDRLMVMLGRESEDYGSAFTVAERGPWMRWLLDHHSTGAKQ